MKVTDRVIDQWIEALIADDSLSQVIRSDKLIEILQNLKTERQILLERTELLMQQLRNAEIQIGHLTHLTSGLRK